MKRGPQLVAASLFAQLLKACSDNANCLIEERGYLAYEQEQFLWSYFPIIPVRKLERLLPNPQEDRCAVGTLTDFIYLSPIREGALPLLNCEWDFDAQEPSCRIRVMLFKLLEANRWTAWGFRVESPESPGEKNEGKREGVGKSAGSTAGIESRHGYWHIQLIREFVKSDSRVQSLVHTADRISWFPESDPAFPIAARDSADALLTVLISLYGPDRTLQFCQSLSWKQRDAIERLRRLAQVAP